MPANPQVLVHIQQDIQQVQQDVQQIRLQVDNPVNQQQE